MVLLQLAPGEGVMETVHDVGAQESGDHSSSEESVGNEWEEVVT